MSTATGTLEPTRLVPTRTPNRRQQTICDLKPVNSMSAADENPGRKHGDAQGTDARVDEVTDDETGGHLNLETHKTHAASPRRRSLAGYFALQLLDVQKLKVAQANRVHAMERDELGPEWIAAGREVLNALDSLENACERRLTKQGKQHFMADWVEATPGISLAGFTRLIGLVGPLDRFANPSKLWKYAGLHVVDGHAPRREKGVSWTHTNCQGGHLANCTTNCKTDHHPNCQPDGIGTAYSPSVRVFCHQLGESIVKVGRGPYRQAYDQKKYEYETGRPDWTQARRHNAAMRYAVKCLLRDMWIEWHRRIGRVDLDTQDAPANAGAIQD